jgi:hypothetical protein
MRYLLLVGSIVAAFIGTSGNANARGTRSAGAGTGSSQARVYVPGDTRQNGTHVSGHYRSAPDGKFSNNWSTKGNINPVTGTHGHVLTPQRHVRPLPRLYGPQF